MRTFCENIWRMVKNIPEYNLYFPDYLKGELHERQYMLDILYSINSNAILELVKEARRKRGLAEEKDTQQLIDITPDY